MTASVSEEERVPSFTSFAHKLKGTFTNTSFFPSNSPGKISSKQNTPERDPRTGALVKNGSNNNEQKKETETFKVNARTVTPCSIYFGPRNKYPIPNTRGDFSGSLRNGMEKVIEIDNWIMLTEDSKEVETADLWLKTFVTVAKIAFGLRLDAGGVYYNYISKFVFLIFSPLFRLPNFLSV